MVAESEAVVSMIMNSLIGIVALVLCIKQWFIDSEFEDNGELVFINFSVIAKPVSCFKQFITAYHAFHNKGSEMSGSGFVSLLGFILQSYTVTVHLNRKYRAWARTTIVGMATLIASGIWLLCIGVLIPKDHAWHTTAVPGIIILTVSFDAALLVLGQKNENGGDQHLNRDLVKKLVEASISIYRWVDLVAQTHNPWDAEKILDLLGGALPVLIGAYHIAWILYKMGTMPKVAKWLKKMGQVFAGEEKHVAGAAMEVDEDCSPDKEGVEVVVAASA